MTQTARVVATPGTMGGQPRLDGTRMTISQLLTYMRGGMTVEQISAEWPHLPAGWFDAIIEWIDSQAVPEVDIEAVQVILDSIPDVPAAPGDEILPDEPGYGPEALDLLNAMEPARKRDHAERVEPKKRPR